LKVGAIGSGLDRFVDVLLYEDGRRREGTGLPPSHSVDKIGASSTRPWIQMLCQPRQFDDGMADQAVVVRNLLDDLSSIYRGDQLIAVLCDKWPPFTQRQH